MKNVLLVAAVLLIGCDGIEVTLEPGQAMPAATAVNKPVTPQAELTIYGQKVKTTFTGKVVAISDGDTITVLNDANEQVKIRLASIDCPEKKQPFGNAAKDAIGRIHETMVTIYQTDKDRWGRTVGFVDSNGNNVNAWLIRSGLAWHYKDYSKSAELAELENQARVAKVGLWSVTGPDDQIPPWEWRKR